MVFRLKRRRYDQSMIREEIEELTLDEPGKVTVHYQWLRKKNLSMRVYPNRLVKVRAPAHAQLDRLRDFVKTHRDWIKKQLGLTTVPSTQTIGLGASIFFLGVPYKLERTAIKSEDGEMTVPGVIRVWQGAEDGTADLTSWVKCWYRRQADLSLLSLFHETITRLPLPENSFNSVRLRWMKRRWGSCGSGGRITLNTALMICPTELIQYVIVHELVHLLVPSHSPLFHQTLEAWLPGAKRLRKEINKSWSQRLF